MASQKKIKILGDLNESLQAKSNFIISTYSGLNVEQLALLRRDIRDQKGVLRVVKNNLFKKALLESAVHRDMSGEFDAVLKGPIAVTFVNGNLPALCKLLAGKSKELPQIKILAGSMDGEYLDRSQLNEIATLPTREELLTTIATGLNSSAQKIAQGISGIIGALARGISAVGEKK